MQVEQLHDGVHLVDHSMFMNKSRKLLQNFVDKVDIVFEADVDEAARNHLLLMIHAQMQIHLFPV